MDQIIKDILRYKDDIESIYLIGSQASKEQGYDSDIDLVIIVKQWVPSNWIAVLKEKHPVLDVTILDKKNIKNSINESPSIYVSAINQIILNKKLVYGNDLIQNISIPREHVIRNQLHFPYYAYCRLLSLNDMATQSVISALIEKPDFLKLNFAKKFKFKESCYFSYRELNTLLLTICAYRLIFNNKFEFRKAGKKWFIKEYLNQLKEDEYYTFIKEYHDFITTMKSFVFDRPSTYLESAEFKTKIYDILLTYLNQLK